MLRLIGEHLVPSALIGLIAYWLFGQWHLVVIPLITGWLIDIDHLLDFTIAMKCNKLVEPWQASIKSGSYFEGNGKVIVFLHSWELIGIWILIWVTIDNWEIGVVGGLAWVVHLLIDHFSYQLNSYTYFLSYRIYHNFAINMVCNTTQHN